MTDNKLIIYTVGY